MIFERTTLHSHEPRAAQRERSLQVCDFELEESVTIALSCSLRTHALDVRSFWAAALGVLFWRYGGGAPHVLGFVSASRSLTCVQCAPAATYTFLAMWRQAHATLSSAEQDGQPTPQTLVIFEEPEQNGEDAIRQRARAEGAELTISVRTRSDSMSLQFAWDAALFETQFVEQLARSFGVLAGSAVADPGQRCAALPILHVDDHRRIVHVWNQHAASPKPITLCQLFEEQLRARPNHAAVVHGDRSLSYRELDSLCERVAARLRNEGIGRDMPVGIYVGRSIAMVVGMLAVLKAGGCFVPLDPSYPPERLAYILADCGAKLVIADRGSALEFASSDCRVLDYQQLIEGGAGARHESSVSPEDLAYIIYTSGSTGAPKGVMVQHRAIANFLIGHNRFAKVHSGERHAQVASFSFDVALFEMLSPLVAGATCVIAPDLAHVSMAEFRGFLEEQHISSAFVPPAYWQSWMNSLLNSGQKVPACITRFYIGADKIESHMVALWNQVAHSQVQLINGYGPTEATVCTSAYRFAPGQAFDSGERVPIGRPTGCSMTYIVDEDLNIVPSGVVGELVIGGGTLAAGYFKRPGLTAERFIPDYYSGLPAQRAYLSGDLARYRADGTLDFLGRIDDQVKIRGFRVELGEIEHAAHLHADVEQAVALVDQRIAGTKQLALFVVRRSAAAPSLRQATLRRHLQDKLPAHMVPARIAFIERMPSSPNGKIARDQLLALDSQRSSEADYVAPRDAVEQGLVEIWAKVLLMEAGELGVLDEFSALGVSSLMFLAVAEQIGRRFGEAVAADLLKQPPPAHIAALSAQLGKLRSEAGC